jgi:glutamate formiminotransferase
LSLLAVPNVSEGRDFEVLDRLQDSLGNEVILLDRHTDIDHNRAVFTLAGPPADLGKALVSLAAAAREIDMGEWSGLHPAIGGLDVCPVVWLDPQDRDRADALAVKVAAEIGELGIPVFLYGELARGKQRRERAWFREGGVDALWQRMSSGELKPDYGPDRPHPKAGGCLVASRPPLAAFNVELDTGDVEVARAVAAEVRELGGGPSGLRAIGLALSTGRAQVSMNVHDPASLPLAEVVERVSAGASRHGAKAIQAELIGLIPEAALSDYPESVPIRDFDPAFHIIERRLG